MNMEPPGVLSDQQCEKLLEVYTKKNVVLKSSSIEPLSGLNGLIAKQYKIKLEYIEDEIDRTAQFFVKSLEDSNPVMYKIAKEMQAHKKESFFYGTLLPLLERSDINCSYAPKGYFYENTTIVLEDLSLLSYKEFPKNKPLDFEQCKKCLETLARLHATPIVYELRLSEQLKKSYRFNEKFEDILRDILNYPNEECGVLKYIRNSISGLSDLIDLVPVNGFDVNKLKKKMGEVFDIMMSIRNGDSEYRSTIIHNDLWCTNFLCRFNDSGKVENCKLIDFQTISYGPPAMDVLGFIYTNTRKEFRDKYYEELLNYYYYCFCQLLDQEGIEADYVLPESQFRNSCEVYKIAQKIFAVLDRCITFTSDEDYFEASKSEENFARFLFEERGIYMTKCYKENEEFRDLIIEEIGEIASMLI